MSRNLTRMLLHAESALRNSLDAPQAERVRCCQHFLKVENRRLLSRHRAGAGGIEIAHGRSLMMDTLLHYIFQGAIRSTQPTRPTEGIELSIVATGGYGRGELNPCSDVDILFLLPAAKGPDLESINSSVEHVLYVLWDLGLKVGHATRTIRECVEQARQDMVSRTALSEARLLDGSRTVFAQFQQTLYEQCVRGQMAAYIEYRHKDIAQRRARYGHSVFVQEPNVKNGCGGLRDLQSLLWIARFKSNIGSIEELQQAGLLAQIETGRLKRARDFLMRVRNELHYSHGRAVDEIPLSFQPKLAEALGYRRHDVLQRIEMFMRDYYRHARDIHLLTEALAERLAIEDEPRPGLHRWSGLFSFRNKSQPLEGGLVLRNGVIEAADSSTFPSSADELMRVFHTAQIHEARIGPGLQSRIRASLRLVNRGFLYARGPRDIFLSILRSKGEAGRVLRAMHECGFLGEYIPEFGRLDCLVQHEFYHRYTADEHTLVAIEKLDDLLDANEGAAAPYRRIFQQLENPHVLYLAILLHDTGKAVRTRHHSEASTLCAQAVARRFCLGHDTRSTLLWLVDHHMTMSNLAQRRDIEDPSTIEDFRTLVGTKERLDMLHLLTFVDGQAVGSTSWNEWRQSLLWQLYDQTGRSIAASGIAQVDSDARRRQLLAAVRPRLSPAIMEDEIEAHSAHMPQRYWNRVEEDELIWHFDAIHAFLEQLLHGEGQGFTPVVRWRHFPDRGFSEAVVCSWDRHGLFAKIAGAFAASRINILHADIYTRHDDMVLDLFQVCDLDHRAIEEESRLRKMETLLTASLSGAHEFSFEEVIREEYESMRHIPHQGEERFPTVVSLNNDDSAEYTILEIQTPDRLGLLHHILQTLTDCGLDIGLAKINTEKGAAMDVFYVTDTEGAKITDEKQLEKTQSAIREMIRKLNAPYQSHG